MTDRPYQMLPPLDEAQRDIAAVLSSRQDVRLFALGGDTWRMAFVMPAMLPGWWHLAVIEITQTIWTTRRPVATSRVPAFLEHMGVRSASFSAQAAEPTDHNPMESWPVPRGATSVYFIQAIDGGPVKIGHAASIASRLKSLQTGSPVLLRVLATIPGAGQAGEAALHKRFVRSRSHGEWFRPTPGLMEYIARHAGSVAAALKTGGAA